jgi:peptidoglycan/xylan/chitin deacetylase (PgdA/CDA1 family)
VSPRRRSLALLVTFVVTLALIGLHTVPSALAAPGPGGDYQGFDTPNPPGGPADKVVSLTFDDGPQATYTPQILAVLTRYGVRATFFEIGRQAEHLPDLVKAIVAAGSVVANHTWDHLALTSLDDNRFAFEVDHTTQVLESISGQHVSCLRPPYGSSNPATVQKLAARGLTSVLWTSDSEDYTKPGVANIVNHALANLQPGGVILMHDGGGDRSQTVAALPRIIERVQAAGYRIAPLCAPDLHLPVGALTSVKGEHPGRIVTSGWASDPDSKSPITIHLYVDGTKVAEALADGPGTPGPTWSLGVAARPGPHTVCAYAINVGAGSGNPGLGCQSALVPAITALDDLRPLATQARFGQLEQQALLLARLARLEGDVRAPWRLRAAIVVGDPVRALGF